MAGKKLIDFTGLVKLFQNHQQFNDAVIAQLREGGAGGEVVVVDFAKGISEPSLVSDHLNVSGVSPLMGANNAIGERFPVVNEIYEIENSKLPSALHTLPRVVVAGVNEAINAGDKELTFLKTLGADATCKNIVPTMLIAAHAKKKVLAVLVPEGQTLNAELLSALASLN